MRILFLTHRLPYAPNRGDRLRAYHMLRWLSTWAEVDLVSLVHDKNEASHAGDLSTIASSVTVAHVARSRNLVKSALALPTERTITHVMLDSPGLGASLARIVAERRPALVLAYCSGMARFALEPPLRQIPFVLDMVDVDSAKWAALSGINWPPFSWVYAREARLLARFEAVAARHARMTFVVTERERETLSAIAPDARVEIVPNGVDATNFQPHGDPATDEVVVFCGVMNYAPNVDGVVWLAREVWPLVRARKPGARLEIVGSDPTNAVKALADERSEISVTGRVPDVRQHLWRAAIAVAPLQTARGVQNKVLEAVAAGLPTVVTPLVAQGLPSEIIGACIIADGPAAFCDAIVTLLNLPPSERRRRALLADLTGLSWDRRLQPLHQLLTAAAGG